MYDHNAHHGIAHQKAWMEIPVTDIPAIQADEESTPHPSTPYPVSGGLRRYAQLVYQVNPVPIEVSGGLSVDTGNLELINEATNDILSGQTNVLVQDICNKMLSGIVEPALATVVEADGDFTWVAEGLAGTTRASSTWRVKQIETITSGSLETTEITWADGNGNFDNTATYPLSSLTFS